jgi:hypothetical protein
MIRVWNHIKGSSLAGRRILYLHLPVTRTTTADTQVASKHSTKSKHRAATQTAANTVLRHKVKRGETLTSIATSTPQSKP